MKKFELSAKSKINLFDGDGSIKKEEGGFDSEMY